MPKVLINVRAESALGNLVATCNNAFMTTLFLFPTIRDAKRTPLTSRACYCM